MEYMPEINTLGLIAVNLIQSAGNWRVHSVFKHNINIVNNQNELLTLSSDMAKGPFSLNLSGFFDFIAAHIERKDAVSISPDGVTVGQFVFPIKKDASLYDARVSFPSPPVLEKSFVQEIQQLIFEEYKKSEYASFYHNNFIPLVNKLEDGQAQPADLLGLGFGATPSGDDFIMGYILWQSRGKEKAVFSRKLLFHKTNVISANYIFYLQKGHITEKIKKIVENLFTKDKIVTLREARSYGYTSGIDFLYGFTEALRHFSNI